MTLVKPNYLSKQEYISLIRLAHEEPYNYNSETVNNALKSLGFSYPGHKHEP